MTPSLKWGSGTNPATAGEHLWKLEFNKDPSCLFLAENMQSSITERQARANYRHELRTLTYVNLNEGNGGIVRNLSHEGVAVQAVARLQPEQRVRLRFELRFPRLRVEAYGQVSWASASGKCGIRFVDLPASTRRQIDEWIFSNLLDSIAREAANPQSIFASAVIPITAAPHDGLTVSDLPLRSIRLEPMIAERGETRVRNSAEGFAAHFSDSQLNWLSRPLSARSLAWVVDGLVLIAGLLLFALIFLSIAHELPQWELTLSGGFAAAVFVAGTYWTLFAVLGGPSLGARLAQVAWSADDEEESDWPGRFR
jgi:hypothetical protein